jgi:hypothetical protein
MEIITAQEARERGLKRYYTGKPCKRGHYSERHLSGPCYACAKEDYHAKKGPKQRAANAKKKADKIEAARLATLEFCAENGITFVTVKDAKARGLPRYFDGVKCSRGHLSERFTSSYHCVECGKERAKKYVEDHPDRRKETLARYAEENYEQEAERRRKFVERMLEENPDYFKQRYAEYKSRLAQDPSRHERLKKRAREYAALPEVRDRARWRAKERRETDDAHREQCNIRTQLRRQRIRQATPKWLDTDLLVPFYREAMRRKKETGTAHSVDHYYPLQGETVCGLNVPWNLQVITWSENSAKHNRMPEEFYGPNHTPPTGETNGR